MRPTVLLLPLLLFQGCNTPIEDGRAVGPLRTAADAFTSSFVLPYGAGAVLFDAGLDAGATPIADVLAEQDLGLADITDILITHAHGDHLGGLAAFPAANVWLLAAEEALFAEEAPDGAPSPSFLTDGQVLTFGVHTVEVFHIPGHTAGSAAYLVDGVLVLGDSAIANADGTFGQVAAGYSDDTAQIDRSLASLAERLEGRHGDIEWLAPAHSAPLEGMAPLLDYLAGLDDR